MSVTLYVTNARHLADHLPRALSLLSPARRAAAQSQWREKDRLLRCAAGLLLRHALGVEDESVFAIGEYGKPYLPHGPHFSLSYSGHCAVLALSEREVGADVEYLHRPDVLPRKVLTQEEMEWLAQHGSADDFCLLWTRLESALKAEGCGLALNERNFSLLRNGEDWYWDSRLYDGHLITCAAKAPFTVLTKEMTAEDLLQ